MITGKKVSTKFNNAGFSLVELLVVIAILGIMTGGVVVGMNLMFSKDAEQGATKLNDAISSARTYSMSKNGNYKLEIEGDATNLFTATIYNGTTAIETYNIDDSSSAKRITNIDVTLLSNVPEKAVSTVSNPKVVIEFDKAKGCVNKVKIDTTEVTLTDANGLLQFNLTSSRGLGERKNAMVQLVTATGKHAVGDL